MTQLIEPEWILPLILYAETHYRFRYFFSLLKKREPEILADAPQRIEPGFPIPLLLLAKDSDRFPCTLVRAGAVLTNESGFIKSFDLLEASEHLATPYWWKVFHLEVQGLTGWVALDVSWTISVEGVERTYHNDNYRTSSHAPLRVYLDREHLPRMGELYWGDIHTHSSYTEDQVEYGAPLEAARSLCRGMGLTFFCTTDHSYDLDDTVGDYLRNDSSLPKWKALQSEVSRLNDDTPDVVIIRGEEATVRNTSGRNVHLLMIGNSTFVHGSGDGAERWLRTKSEHAIHEAISLKEYNTVCYAAHPQEYVPFLQKVLLGRGNWLSEDLQTPGLDGVQFSNGTVDGGFRTGYEAWVKLLLEGRKLFLGAGNDAHGNFNRFRQLRIPFVMLTERETQLFGKFRTGVFLQDKPTESGIVDALSKGRSVISDGPAATISVRNESGEEASVGESVRAKEVIIQMSVRSTTTMGWIRSARVFLGRIDEEREESILESNGGWDCYRLEESLPLVIRHSCYLRAEVWTSADQSFDAQEHFCLTNPIWISPP